tara:strand:+ start:1842 stop:3383 length:1542 start_codon:yes stop_codon:yes gene_type:complete
MLNARQAQFQAEHDDQLLDHIKYLSAPVGSGKTQAVIEDIRDNLDQSYIFVTPTRKLAQQIKNRLDAALVNHGQGENTFLLISDEQEPEPVIRRAMNRINGKRPDENHILVITTEAFRNLLPQMTDAQKSGYTVYLDEGIDAIDHVEFRTQRQEVFLEPIDHAEDGSLSITQNGRELLEAVARNPGRLAALNREELNTPNFAKIAKLLVSDIYDVYGSIGDASIRVVAFLRPDHFLAFRSVVIIMAIFEQSLLALFWREKYGINFQRYEPGGDLFDTHVQKGPLIRIHHLLHAGDNASRLNLERNSQTGERAADHRGGERVIDRMAEIVNEHFDHVPYCWAANAYFTNAQRLLNHDRMPAVSAGLNDYHLFDTVVTLLTMNPPPWVKDMVIRHVEIADDELYELWKISHTYQTIGRCSLRNRDANREIDIVVLSRDCAQRIHALFPGSRIVGQLGDLQHFGAMRRGRGAGNRRIPYTDADNAAWYRFQRANPDNVLTKEEWYRDIRNPGFQDD